MIGTSKISTLLILVKYPHDWCCFPDYFLFGFLFTQKCFWTENCFESNIFCGRKIYLWHNFFFLKTKFDWTLYVFEAKIIFGTGENKVNLKSWSLTIWLELQGVLKKIRRSFCFNMLEDWDIIHLKGKIHSSVWGTKSFLYDIREPR